MNIQSEVKKFIVDTFLFGDDSGIEANTSFLQKNILDSTGILELVAFLEHTYQIKISDSEMMPENLDSLNNINTFIAKKKKQA